MTEKKPGLFASYRDHYRATKSEHRPVPVLFPFLVALALVSIAFLFFDPMAAGLYGHWPAWLANSAAHVTDVGRSWWILTLTTILVLGGWVFRRLSGWERGGEIAAKVMAMAFYILCSVGLSTLVANIIKRAVGRPRPIEFPQHGLFSFNPFAGDFNFESFPSGHSTVNGALFMSLALLFPRLRWPLLALGLCLALTRVFVGVHYPSDVTAGFAFGMWFAFATALVFSRFGLLFGIDSGKLVVRT